MPPLASPAPFSRAMGQKSNFCSQHVFTSSSHFQKGVTWPPCPKTLGGDGLAEKSIFWVWAGVQTTCPKITCNESGWPWKFDHYLTMKSKIISHCSGHRRTHILNPSKWKFFVKLFYAWGDGKLQSLQIFYHFTSWRMNIIFELISKMGTTTLLITRLLLVNTTSSNIKRNVCVFVCVFVLYSQPDRWT